MNFEGRAFALVGEYERVRGGAGRGDVVEHAGRKVARGVEARDVRRTGRGDGRPFVRSP